MISVVSEEKITDIEGRLRQIVMALREKDVHRLPGGTIERYLPCYTSDEYELIEEAKRKAVFAELENMMNLTKNTLPVRYGELYDIVCKLPSKADVPVEPILSAPSSQFRH